MTVKGVERVLEGDFHPLCSCGFGTCMDHGCFCKLKRKESLCLHLPFPALSPPWAREPRGASIPQPRQLCARHPSLAAAASSGQSTLLPAPSPLGRGEQVTPPLPLPHTTVPPQPLPGEEGVWSPPHRPQRLGGSCHTDDMEHLQALTTTSTSFVNSQQS